MKKQTAVEWLINELEKHHIFLDIKNTNVYMIAKQMEKEQIMEAYSKGEFNDGCNENEEEYYNQTYK